MRIFSMMSIALLLFGSCTSASRKSTGHKSARTIVRVENQNAIPMMIYIVKHSERIRLGRVTEFETGVFPIPDYVLSGTTSLRLLADPVGSSRSPVSEEFLLSPGDVIEMVIRPF